MKPTTYPKTPELDRMKLVRDDSQTIGNFIEWLSENNMCIAKEDSNKLYAIHTSIEKLLAEYYDIDLK